MLLLSSPLRPLLSLIAVLAVLAPTVRLAAKAPADPSQMAFLGHAEEQTYSEILQANQRVLLQIELVDTVRPKLRKTVDKVAGYLVPPGNRRVQFRVVLPSMGFMDSGSREARGFFDVTLVAGHRYRIVGQYVGQARTFRLFDVTTHEAITPPLDLGFFGPVRRDTQFIPIIVPIK